MDNGSSGFLSVVAISLRRWAFSLKSKKNPRERGREHKSFCGKVDSHNKEALVDRSVVSCDFETDSPQPSQDSRT